MEKFKLPINSWQTADQTTVFNNTWKTVKGLTLTDKGLTFETDEEILDNIDIKVIEKYLRKKKLEKIKNQNDK